jgi:hypothetical protein
MDLKSKGNIMKNFIYIPFLITILLLSCVNEEKPLELIKVAEFSSSKVTDASLARILYKNNGLKVNVRYTLSEDEAFNQLENKKVDLVIIPNNAKSVENNFRTLVPLLPRVLMILTNKKVDSMSIKDLFEKGHVYFEDNHSLQDLGHRWQLLSLHGHIQAEPTAGRMECLVYYPGEKKILIKDLTVRQIKRIILHNEN